MQSSIPQSTPPGILLGVATGRCGMQQDTGAGFALPPTSPGLASAVGSRKRTQCGVWGCPWSLGVLLGDQRLPWSVCSLAKPWQVGFAPG